MEEDSRNALFVEPNAYIQKYESKEKNNPQKIVFQEPYECLPNYYLNNNFKKGSCDCVLKNQNDKHKSNLNNHDCNCNRINHQDNNCNNDNKARQSGLGFDLKNLMPLFSLFNKGGGANFGQLVGLLNNGNSRSGGMSNPMSLISGLLSNQDAMSGILNIFKGGGLNLFTKKQSTKKEIKTTDFEIKNYTRVE